MFHKVVQRSLGCGGIIINDDFIAYLWPPCVADADSIFCPVVSIFYLLYSSPNLGGRRLDVYHTSTHDVALVIISNACMKCAACGSLEI